MEINHVFSALNNNIQTTCDGWEGDAFTLLDAVSFLFAATISEH